MSLQPEPAGLREEEEEGDMGVIHIENKHMNRVQKKLKRKSQTRERRESVGLVYEHNGLVVYTSN